MLQDQYAVRLYQRSTRHASGYLRHCLLLGCVSCLNSRTASLVPGPLLMMNHSVASSCMSTTRRKKPTQSCTVAGLQFRERIAHFVVQNEQSEFLSLHAVSRWRFSWSHPSSCTASLGLHRRGPTFWASPWLASRAFNGSHRSERRGTSDISEVSARYLFV